MNSEKWKLNVKDWIHGFATACFGALVGFVEPILTSGQLPNFSLDSLQSMGKFSLIAGISYILKKFMSNSDGKILSKEQLKLD